MAGMALYTFTEQDRHPMAFIAPNRFTSTHPGSVYRKRLIVQRWRPHLVQVGLVEFDLLRRDPYTQVRIAPADLDETLRDVFGLELAGDDVEALLLRMRPRGRS
jgi:arylamine N-acetyltransferase